MRSLRSILLTKSSVEMTLFLFFCFFVFAFSYGVALAANTIDSPGIKIEIGGFSNAKFDAPVDYKCPDPQKAGEKCLAIGWIGQYIGAVYRYGVGLAAVLAVIMIMAGGFLWLISAGSPERVSKAKDFIISALSGLLLALFSFIILYTVNPRLTGLEPLIVQVPPEMQYVCCQKPGGGFSFQTVVNGECEGLGQGWSSAIESDCYTCCACGLSEDLSTAPKQCYENIKDSDSCTAKGSTIKDERGQEIGTVCNFYNGKKCSDISQCNRVGGGNPDLGCCICWSPANIVDKTGTPLDGISRVDCSNKRNLNEVGDGYIIQDCAFFDQQDCSDVNFTPPHETGIFDQER